MTKNPTPERKRRMVVLRPAWVVAIALTNLLSTGIFVFAATQASDDAIDKIQSDRDAARVVACQQFNAQQERSRDGEKAQVRSVIDPTRARTPAEKEQIAEILTRHDAQVDESYPDRDCSPSGIAAYYKEPPHDQSP